MGDRRVGGNLSMDRRRDRPKIESGTCNVCYAPCSSCMHRNSKFTGLKSEETSDENSNGVLTSQCSFNTPGEVRNLVNFNHDTSSEIGESKETIRPSGPVLDVSRKDKGSLKVDSCNVLPKEMKSQSSHSLLSDHQARNVPGNGKVKEKSGTENSRDKRSKLSESSPHSNKSEKVGKSDENSLSSEPEESNASAMSESDSDDSEMLELDVKVCDICGDAGREDLLAICSRCTDGAEHTYCMRVFLKKLPEGLWLCEECKFEEEAEKQKSETKGKREAEVNIYTESSKKRHIDKSETARDTKRQAVEASTGSPKRPVLPKLPTFSRETSFKGVEKRKLAHHSSFNNHASDDTESDSQLQCPKGSLSKSHSFNSASSRPKVRPVDDVMLPRQKIAKENAPLDAKEDFLRNVGKSSSTRCVDVGNSCNDSKVKGSKQLKDRSTEANPSASTADQKPISGNTSASRDLKGLQSDGKQGSLTKQARRLSRNRLEDILASVGDTSINEKCSSGEPILREAKRKAELTNLDGLPRSREFSEAGEKNKDAIGQRSDQLPGSNISNTRNITEDINKGNRLRAAVDAALRKRPNFSKNRGQEQSDLPPVSNVDSSCDKALQNSTWKVPVTRDWPVGLQGGHQNLRTDKQTTAVNGKQFTPADSGAMATSQSVEPEAHFPSVKPVVRDFPAVRPTAFSTTSAIPEHEYIWQGDMEVQKGRNLSLIHSGIQAYLSTLASPKVAEVVNQFPVKVTLNEVPRLSTWPTQFQDKGAKEDNVALFFFAKDTESYEKNYKPLVDNMIQKDLALIGNFEGVELLIFASNQLPQKFQRWNMFYFLWGVFRGKKKDCSSRLKNIPKMEKTFSTHENPSNRESLADCGSSRMQPCIKDNVKEKEEKEKRLSVEEAEEGEIGVSPCLIDNKSNESASRIVFPLDLNDSRPLGNDLNEQSMDPTLELATGGLALPFLGRKNSIEEHRSINSHSEEEEDNAASLSLSLSFTQQKENERSVSEWEQHKKQNVNTPLFLFRDFLDKSS